MGRYLISAVFGGIVTLALAFLMQALIFPDTVLTADAAPVPEMEFLMPDRIEGSRPTPPVRPHKDPPPQPPVMPRTTSIDAPEFPMVVPTTAPTGPIEDGIVMVTNLSPTIRVPPEYPVGPLSQGREGFVVLRFDVNEHGMTQNVRVVMSEPPRIFDRAALRSVQQWRYQPQTDSEGNPITVTGQETTMRFQIEEDGEIAQ